MVSHMVPIFFPFLSNFMYILIFFYPQAKKFTRYKQWHSDVIYASYNLPKTHYVKSPLGGDLMCASSWTITVRCRNISIINLTTSMLTNIFNNFSSILASFIFHTLYLQIFSPTVASLGINFVPYISKLTFQFRDLVISKAYLLCEFSYFAIRIFSEQPGLFFEQGNNKWRYITKVTGMILCFIAISTDFFVFIFKLTELFPLLSLLAKYSVPN